MTLFEAREWAFEQMFVHDEEARFRALARRNKLLGPWAATQIGLSGAKADAYVNEISQNLVARVIDEAWSRSFGLTSRPTASTSPTSRSARKCPS